MRLTSCEGCRSFVPERTASCPNCGVPRSEVAATPNARVLRGALALAGGSLFAVTLSACYGGGGDYYYDDDAGSSDANGTCEDVTLDDDGDGFCGDYDCDENDPDRYEGAPEAVGDELDSNCDGRDD